MQNLRPCQAEGLSRLDLFLLTVLLTMLAGGCQSVLVADPQAASTLALDRHPRLQPVAFLTWFPASGDLVVGDVNYVRLERRLRQARLEQKAQALRVIPKRKPIDKDPVR